MNFLTVRSKAGKAWRLTYIATVRSQPFLICPANAKLFDSGTTETCPAAANKGPPYRSSVARDVFSFAPLRSSCDSLRQRYRHIRKAELARSRVYIRARGKVSHRHGAHVEGVASLVASLRGASRLERRRWAAGDPYDDDDDDDDYSGGLDGAVAARNSSRGG